MKRFFLLFLFIWIGAVGAKAAVIQLNNNIDRPAGHINTWTAAQDSAVAGDTIMVHGSPTGYGSISLTKALVIIGPGHKPNKVPSHSANFSSINIGSNKTGVRIYGVVCSGNISFGTNTVDLLIDGVHASISASSGISSGSSGIIIRNSVLDGINIGSGTIDQVVIQHNYIYENGTGNILEGGFDGFGNKLVNQNIIIGRGNANLIGSTQTMRNTVFTNNIFYGVRANIGTQVDCVYGNNLSFGHTTDNSLPPAGQTGSDNIVNQDPQFVNAQPVSQDVISTFYTRNFRLQETSPAKGTGTFGTDMGIYTDSFDFSMTGEPLRPQMLFMNANPGLVPPGGTTTINFSGRKATNNAQ